MWIEYRDRMYNTDQAQSIGAISHIDCGILDSDKYAIRIEFADHSVELGDMTEKEARAMVAWIYEDLNNSYKCICLEEYLGMYRRRRAQEKQSTEGDETP